MTSPSSRSARAVGSAPRIAAWAAGPIVVLLRHDAAGLVAPSRCPTLVELASIAAVRFGPDVAVGRVLAVLQAIAIVVALAVFGELVWRRTQHAALALATAAAVGLSPLFPGALAPPDAAAAFGVACALALAVLWARSGGGSPASRAARTSALLVLASLVVPSWTLPAAAAAAALAAVAFARRGRVRALGVGVAVGGAVIGAALAVLSASPPDALGAHYTAASCVVPPLSLTRTVEAIARLTFWLGPFGLGLAALGAFVDAQAAGWRTTALIASAVAAALVFGAATAEPAVAAAPAAVLLWSLAAGGLREMAAALRARRVAAVVALALMVLVPALAAARRVDEIRDDVVAPRGHEQQTLRETRALLNLVPEEATFVEEDATVDMLLRAAVLGGRRRLKPVTVLARDAAAIEHALTTHAIYAFPAAQEDLNLQGFVVHPVPSARTGGEAYISGLSVVAARAECRVMADAWMPVSGASGRVAMYGDTEEARGPVTMYFGGPEPGQPMPDGWPPRTLRGFRVATFDRASGERSARLVAEAREQNLAADTAALAQPYVIRLTLHRTPRAPHGLAARLGASFSIGVARRDPDAAGGRLTVCDAPPIVISPLPSRE